MNDRSQFQNWTPYPTLELRHLIFFVRSDTNPPLATCSSDNKCSQVLDAYQPSDSNSHTNHSSPKSTACSSFWFGYMLLGSFSIHPKSELNHLSLFLSFYLPLAFTSWMTFPDYIYMAHGKHASGPAPKSNHFRSEPLYFFILFGCCCWTPGQWTPYALRDLRAAHIEIIQIKHHTT